MRSALFYLGFAVLMTHELDAVRHQEWRILILLRDLPEAVAETVFISLHVPLIALLLWLTHHQSPSVRNGMRLALSAFLIVHVGLHMSLMDHPAYGFDTPLSMALIVGGGLTGLAHLVLSCTESRRRRLQKAA